MATSVGVWESRLAGVLTARKKSGVDEALPLLQAADQVELWGEDLKALTAALKGEAFCELLAHYPLVTCAAASEIGHRFEGVGTVFWAKFEGLLEQQIPLSQRGSLAEAFEQIARRFPIQRPPESGFSSHFSIIAWPIANAIMPYDMAGPVGRLLANGPVSGLGGAARRADLSGVRAWATAWEGARLADWLQMDAVAVRVIGALLTDNRDSAVPAVSFRRLREAFTHQSEAYFALARAKQRRAKAAASPSAADLDLGRLSLQRQDDDFLLSVAWTPLPPTIAEAARQAASASGWRPKLWGQSRTRFENVLGPLPIPLKLETFPSGVLPACADAAAVFAEAETVAAQVSARQVDWDAPLLFEVVDSGDAAPQIAPPIQRSSGLLWLIDTSEAFAQIPLAGWVANAAVRQADLSNPDHRSELAASGWRAKMDAQAGVEIIRAPLDAITLRRGRVRPSASYLRAEGAAFEMARARSGQQQAGGLIAEDRRAEAPATPQISVLQRDTAFESLVEERLAARLDSDVPGARWTVEAMLVIDERIVAYSRGQAADSSAETAGDTLLLQALQSEPARRSLLEAGVGELRMRVGHAPWESLQLKRIEGEVDWNATHPAGNLTRPSSEVAAVARQPYRFAPIGEAPREAAWIQAYEYDEGALASPALMHASHHYQLGDLTADFGEIFGIRRLTAEKGGLIDLARARRAWAGAECRTLAALAARVRVVHQFERPLVAALCGPDWCELEEITRPLIPERVLLNDLMQQGAIDVPEAVAAEDMEEFAFHFTEELRARCPSWAEDGVDDEAGDEALNAAFEAMLASAHREGRLEDLTEDDVDFGAEHAAWIAAAQRAVDHRAGSPLLALVAPTQGAEALTRAVFNASDLAGASRFLADWTQAWCLPRSVLNVDLASAALQFWLNPLASGFEQPLRRMARDTFLARAVRYLAAELRGKAAPV